MMTFASRRSSFPAPHAARAGLLLACAAAFTVLPALRAAPKPAAPTPAATAAPAADAPLDAANLAALRDHVGAQVKISGTPTGTGHNKAGNVGYLNFAGAHQAVSLVVFFKPGQTGALTSEDDLKPFVGKPVVVTGKLSDYKGDLQIVVESLDQIKAAP